MVITIEKLDELPKKFIPDVGQIFLELDNRLRVYIRIEDELGKDARVHWYAASKPKFWAVNLITGIVTPFDDGHNLVPIKKVDFKY